jgi:Holliday junction DNA helicase RuvA
MYAYIRGVLTRATPDAVVVEAGGVGYRIGIPLSAFSRLPQVGLELKLFVAHVVREDAELLYGFLEERGRDFFEQLTAISGVGPKMALALIGHLEPRDLQRALSQENISLICKVPGIGKKTAERLVIELRDKMQLIQEEAPSYVSSAEKDALSALLRLGYPEPRAEKAVQTVVKEAKSELSLAQLITLALRQI